MCTRRDGSLENPKHMFKLIDKEKKQFMPEKNAYLDLWFHIGYYTFYLSVPLTTAKAICLIYLLSLFRLFADSVSNKYTFKMIDGQ